MSTNGNGGRASILARLRHLLGGRQPEHSLRDSIAELVQEAAEAHEEPGEQPELDRQERALIANILRLRETTADDVMLPRADIVAMRVDVTLEQALEQIREDGHSRLPVYREQLDDIIGMVHIKDVFAYIGRPGACAAGASAAADPVPASAAPPSAGAAGSPPARMPPAARYRRTRP